MNSRSRCGEYQQVDDGNFEQLLRTASASDDGIHIYMFFKNNK